MPKSEDQIKIIIKNYIDKNGGSYISWYVGIAENPKERLFDDHGVDEHIVPWIHEPATDASTARRIESYFINVIGTSGGTGGGTDKTKSVYAYRKTSSTKP